MSTSALSYGGITYDISDHVVVFTYDGADPDTASGYGIATIADAANKWFSHPSRIYFNDMGDVAALLISTSGL